MPSGFRHLPIRLHSEDLERLRFIAERRGTQPADLAGDLIASWLAGPGRDELVSAVLGTTPVRRRHRGELDGQLRLAD